MKVSAVYPLLLGPKNAEAATGLPWRHVRDHARARGVHTVRIGRKTVVPAAEFLEAVLGTGGQQEEPVADPAAWARREIVRMRGSGK